MKKLIDLGSNVNHNNMFGTVFHILVARGEDPVSIACMDYLLSLESSDADMSASNVGGSFTTPLSLAIRIGNFVFAEKLIRKGFVDTRNMSFEMFKYKKGAFDSLKLAYFTGFKFDLVTFRDSCHPVRIESPAVNGQQFDTEDMKEFNGFIQFLKGKSGQVLSLKDLIRIHFRTLYRLKCIKIIQSLKIPKILSDFILLNSINK